jgi:cytochrome c-type biogenesis protein CcmH/NrfG
LANVIRVQGSFVSQKRSSWVNLVVVLAILAFAGLSMIPLLGIVLKDNSPSAQVSATSTPTIPVQKQDELEAQAKGYELVVQREPQNETALRGLLETRLRLGDIQGAITPLEQIVKLHPEQPDYSVLLAQAKQQTGDKEGAAQNLSRDFNLEAWRFGCFAGACKFTHPGKTPRSGYWFAARYLKNSNAD